MELVRHYTQSFKMITGTECAIDTSDPLERIEKNLRAYFQGSSQSGR
jgi:hypothetical protein